jgi:hypothetical protein
VRRIVRTAFYERRSAKLLNPLELEAMEQFISENPERHPVIPGTGGFRKARWWRQGSGKRGGVRVVYLFVVRPDLIYMADVYAKNQKENLSDAERKALKKISAQIKAQHS